VTKSRRASGEGNVCCCACGLSANDESDEERWPFCVVVSALEFRAPLNAPPPEGDDWELADSDEAFRSWSFDEA
jgi:hypothetical protein